VTCWERAVVPKGVAFSLALCASVGLASCELVFPIHDNATGTKDASGAAEGSVALDASFSNVCHVTRPYKAEVMSDTPALYLRFDEASGQLVAMDQTCQYDGTYPDAGVTYQVQGALTDGDPAVSLDGTAGIAMPPGLDFAGTSPFSVEFWANQTDQTGFGFAVDHGDYVSARSGWDMILPQEAGVAIERWNSGKTEGSSVTSASPLSRNEYHHIVGTFDGSKVALYIDAQLQAFTNVATPLPEAGIPWSIGRENCMVCGTNGYVGSLDELAVYTKALAPDRIVAHYCASGRTPSP
jgi:hypothetical protein